MKRRCLCLLFALTMCLSTMVALPVAAETYTAIAEVSYGGNRYVLYDKAVTYHEAKAYCESIGGHLVTIGSTEENNAVKSLIQNGSNSAYIIGGNDEITERTWTWITGEPWNYTNWDSGEPNNAGGEDFASIYKANGLWNDITISNTYGFVCEFDHFEPVTTMTHNGHTYQIFNNSVSWEYAKTYCELIGGHLATITNESENSAIANALGTSGKFYWLGATDECSEGTWTWVTGEKWNYSNWESGQPDNAGSAEHHLHIYTTSSKLGKWNDVPNMYSGVGFVCEFNRNIMASGSCGNAVTYTIDDTGLLSLFGTGAMYDYASQNAPWLSYAEQVKNIAITDKITYIGNNAFQNCSNLKTIYYAGTEDEWNTIKISGKNDSLLNSEIYYAIEDNSTEKGWSEWSTEYPAYHKNVKKRTEYSYRNKSTTTSSNNSLSGWVHYNTTSSGYGDWSGWSIDYPGDKTGREIQSKRQWHYHRYTNAKKTLGWPIPGNDTPYKQNSDWLDYALEYQGKGEQSGHDQYGYGAVDGSPIWWYNQETRTLYRYRDTAYLYHFYKWTNWSDWNVTPQTVTSDKEVKTRTVYSYQLIAEEPTISEENRYNGTFVTLSSATPTASIIYTLDGSEPSKENGTYYSEEPVKVKESCTLKAIAVSEGYLNSAVVSKEYIVNLGDVKYLTFDSETGKITGCDEDAVSIIIPDEIDGYKVTGIADNAFVNAKELTKVVIPSGVTEIGKYAFNNLETLVDVTIPDTVTTIGEHAFSGCKALTRLELPNSITTIDKHAFSNCTNLVSINIPNKLTTISSYLFENDLKLENITIPDSVVTIKDHAFTGCSSLKTLDIPNSVTTIENGAFEKCAALTTVTIPDSVTTIGTSIFAFVRENVTVKCYLDTTAHKRALEDGIKVELMSRGVLGKPTFEKNAIQGGINISLSAPKGTIYYTKNGTEPTTSSSKYNSPITAKQNMTIKAIAVADGWTNSEIAEFYTDMEEVSAPYGSLPSGTRVESGTKIELYCETDGAEIWCTTNGRTPTSEDVYTGEIEINKNTKIYAYAVKNGMIDSTQVTLDYYISTADDTPIVTTLDATDITETSAKVSADVYENNGVLYDVQFVYYEKNNSSVKYTAKANENHSAVLTGLSPDTEYWYQVRAINEKGWSYGYIKSFKTDAQGIIKPTSIEIEPSYLSMNEGKKKTLLATVLPVAADNREVYWSSEDTSVATVDENGVVTAVGLGNTRVKATTISNRLVAYCNIDVIRTNLRGEFDFSENHMITYSSYYNKDYGWDLDPDAGGNAQLATAYLTRWEGAVLDANDPYPTPAVAANIKYRKGISADYHIQNIIYLPHRAHDLDNDEIKKAVMKYGAVYTSFKVRNPQFFDSTQTNYYFPYNQNLKSTDGGHAVVIVGWDDNYPRVNFKNVPAGDGAFICKNSWGTGSGENGYFYVSYYDKYLGKLNIEDGQTDYNTVFYNAEDINNYNKIYQYDHMGPTTLKTYPNTKKVYAANAFPEKGKVLEQNEQLKAVSFYNTAQGTAYEIYVVTDFKDVNSLKSLGSPLKTGVLDYAGYFTINLDSSIELKAGTRFAVVVKYISRNDVGLFVEAPIEGLVDAKSNAGESFIRKDDDAWNDYTIWAAENSNLCIKAFTDTGDSVMLMQAIDNVGREYESDKTYTIEALQENGFEFNPDFIEYVENKDNITLFSAEEGTNLGSIPPTVLPDLNTNNNYSEGATLPAKYDLRDEECMTAVKNQGKIGSCWAFATYASLESCLKKASYLSKGSAGGGLNQATSGASSIVLNTTGTMLSLGNTVQLEATISPVDSTAQLVWESSNNSIVSVSSRGLVRALGIGDATVTAKTLDGKVSAECKITVTSPVPVSSISINNTESDITAGNKILMDYSVYPENAGNKNIIWSVDNTQIASINEYGLLSTTGGGTVTVTATSSDGNVFDSFTLNIDDGMPCNIEITGNNLEVYDTNIFGDLTANVTNKTSKTMNATVMMGIYDSEGRLVTMYSQVETLAVGDNSIEFSRKYIPGLIDKKFNVKIFVWSDTQKLMPLAVAKASVIE